MRILFLLIFISTNAIIFGQDKFTDSLIVALQTAKNDSTKVNNLNVLSLKLTNAAKFDTALYYVTASRSLSEKLDFKKGLGNALHITGLIYYTTGNMTEAKEFFSSAYKTREKINDRLGMGNSSVNLGNICYSKADFDCAAKQFKASLKVYEEINHKNGIALCYNNLGNIYIVQGNYADAIANFNGALKVYIEINNKSGIANCYNNKGVINQYQGDYAESLKNHNEALKVRKLIGEKSGIAMSYLNVGYNYMALNMYKEALVQFDSSLKISKEVQDKRTMTSLYNNISGIHKEQGDYTTAIKYATLALNISKESGDKAALSAVYINIGNIHFAQGDLNEALKAFKITAKINEEIGDKKTLANAYNNMGIIYLYQGNNPLAFQTFVKSLDLKKEIGDKHGLSESYNNIGDLYFQQGNYTEALKNFVLSLKLMEELGEKKGISTNYNNIGNIYKEQKKYEEALSNYNMAFKLKEEISDKNGMSLTYIFIGELYRLQKKYPEALNALSAALKISTELGDKQNQATAYLQMGLVRFQLGEMNDARSNAELSLKLAREIGIADLIKNADLLLGKIYIKEGDLKLAEKYLLDVVKINNKNIALNFPIMSEKEQEIYFNTLSKEYMLFNSFALKSVEKDPAVSETVYNTVVRNKGLLLKSSTAMRNAILNSNDTSLINRYKDWIVLKKQIAKSYAEGKDAKEFEDKANGLEKELTKNSQVFSDFAKVQNITWKSIQKNLKPNEVAIEFTHFEHTENSDSAANIIYCALVVKPGSKYPELIKLFKSKDLEKILSNFTQNDEAYANGIYGISDVPKTELYDLIWKPLETTLLNSKTVFVSPSGLLHKISFVALCSSKNVYVCDKYDLNVQSSTAKVAFPESFVFSKDTKVSVFGGIDYELPSAPSDSNSYLSWNYLEGTRSEVDKIEAGLKKNKINVTFYSGQKATESEFKRTAAENNIMHIATHGFFFPENNIESISENDETNSYGYGYWSFVMNKNPLMRSGLVFAGANGVWNLKEQKEAEDGVLTAQEVANIDMRKAGLAVLSACETGLGDIKGSEGVYGLQRSFKMAGVKYIIMSLWQVPDAETEEFMALFYNSLAKHKNIKIAFAETQKTMRKKYNPFYWAPFVLIE